MTKKEIWVTVSIFVIVLFSVAGSVFAYTKFNNPANGNNVARETMSSSSQQTDLALREANLDGTNSSQQSQSGGLTVVAGENTSNPGQLGSGQVATSNTSSNGCSTFTAPGPDTYSQYEQYKDNQATLTGDIVTCPNGAELKSGYKAAVFYKGWLTNGTLFDQSRPNESGQLQPFILTLGAGQVIRGWEQGLLGMKVGGTRRIIVPPALGYGAAAQGKIPANSMLIFDVELLDIQAPQ